MNTGPRLYLLCALLLPVCASTGCGTDGRSNLVPVEGKVLVDGVPAGNASVYFYPCDPSQQRILAAVTAPDGTFRLSTFTTGDGAPVGDYDVTILWPDYSIPRDECADPLHDRLKLQYADRSKTELHAAVRPGMNGVLLRVTLPAGSWNTPRVREPVKSLRDRE